MGLAPSKASPRGRPSSACTEHGEKSPVTPLSKPSYRFSSGSSSRRQTGWSEGLQLRIQESHSTRSKKTTEENRTLSASESELKDKAAATDRVLHAFEHKLAKMKTEDDRLAQLESSNRKLREDNLANEEKSRQAVRFSGSPGGDQPAARRLSELYTAALPAMSRYRFAAYPRAWTAKTPGRALPNWSHTECGLDGRTTTCAALRGLNAQASHIQQKIAAK